VLILNNDAGFRLIVMPSDLSSLKKLLNSKYTAIVIIFIVSIGVYLNTLPNEFVYDDENQVLRNPWIRHVKYIPEIFLSNFWVSEAEGPTSNYYRPLIHIIYMINYHIFGLKPWGFHLTNVLFHGGVSILLYLLLSVLINQFQTLNSKSKILTPGMNHTVHTPAFIATLLFATHPIHTEPVTCISGISDPSFTLFYLLSFYLYINPVRDKSLNGIKADGKRGKKIILSVFFFFLATLCKEPALTLPLLLLVYDYSFRKDTLSPFSPTTLYHLLKRYLPYLIASGAYFILRTYAIGGFAPLKRHVQLSNYKYFINIFPLFIQYLEKLILPVNLNAFHVFHPVSSILQWKGIIALILTSGFIFLVYIFRKHKVVLFSLLWIVIPLLPVLYIPALGENTFTERYLYLPSVGFVVLVSLMIDRIYPALCNSAGVYQLKALRHRVNFMIVSTLIILTGLYSAGTIKRNYIWRDNYSLWTDTVKKSPESSTVHYNLGVTYSDRNLIDKAVEHYQIALKLSFQYPKAHNNLGNAYSKQGKFDEAIREYMIALRLKPDYPEAHSNFGNVYYIQGNLDKAIEHYQIALKLKPNYPEAHNNLGLAYFDKKLIDKSIEHYQTALRLNPNYQDAYYNLGNVYASQGYLDKAVEEYNSALMLKPDDADARYGLGIVYLELGLKHKAEEEFKMALKLRPDFTPAKEALESIK
jgi:Flp pilus assembly protein TadD